MNPYQSQDITELAKALIRVQKVLQPAVKDATNPFVKNRYASLNSVMESCRGPLLENGIWLCQYPVPVPCPSLDVVNGYGSPTGNHKQTVNPDLHQLGLVTKLTRTILPKNQTVPTAHKFLSFMALSTTALKVTTAQEIAVKSSRPQATPFLIRISLSVLAFAGMPPRKFGGVTQRPCNHSNTLIYKNKNGPPLWWSVFLWSSS